MKVPNAGGGRGLDWEARSFEGFTKAGGPPNVVTGGPKSIDDMDGRRRRFWGLVVADGGTSSLSVVSL